MALTRITKGVIKPNENYDTHNIVSTGIVTSVGLDVNGNADISGSLSVGGVLTYEDVTSIDSVGIITARTGLVSPYADVDDFVSVGSNIHLGNAGVITATSFVGDGSGLIGVASTDNIITGTAATFNTYPVDINAGMTVAGVSTFASNVYLGDNDRLYFGDDNDLQIWHASTYDFISASGNAGFFIRGTNNTTLQQPQLNIRNDANTEDIAKFIQNGAVELYYDNAKKLETVNTGINLTGGAYATGTITAGSNIKANTDGGKLAAGASDDLTLFHDSNRSAINNATGELRILSGSDVIIGKRSAADSSYSEQLAAFKVDGAVELYHDNTKRFETTSSGATVTGTLIADGLTLGSDELINLGSNNNLRLFFEQSSGKTVIQNHYTTLEIRDTSGGGTGIVGAKFVNAAQVELNHNGSKKFETTSSGISVTGSTVISGDLDVDGHTNLDNVSIAGVTTASGNINMGGGNLIFGDSGGDSDDKLVFGAGSDLKIFHNGSNNYIDVAGDGHLYIRPKANFYIQDYTNGEVWIDGTLNGGVKLYDNGIQRFETYSSGATVNGPTLNILPSSGNANLILKSGSGSVYTNIHFKANDNTLTSYITSWSGGTLFLNGTSLIRSSIAGTEITEVASTGFHPVTDSARDLGLNAKRWRNVYADTLYGDGSNLTGITATTINSNTNNYVITGTGTANTLQGESTLTFDGTKLEAPRIDSKGLIHIEYSSSTNTNYMMTMNNNNGIMHIFRGDALYIGNNMNTSNQGSGPNNRAISLKTNGDIINTGNITASGYVDSASDIKLKTNIKTIDNALDKVLQIRGAEYDRIDKDNQHEIGVIAQEVEKIIPEVVHGDETKTVSYGNLVGLLIEAVKDLKKEIDELKSS